MKKLLFFLTLSILGMWGAVVQSSMVDNALTPGVWGGLCLIVSVFSAMIFTSTLIDNWTDIKSFFVKEFDEDEYIQISQWWSDLSVEQRVKDANLYFSKIPEELDYEQISFIYYSNKEAK